MEPVPPAGIGAVEDGQMLGPDVRRAFQRHRTAAIEGGRLDLARAETQSAEQIEARPVEVAGIEAERAGAEVDTERPLVEGEVQVEGGIEGALDARDDRRREALARERGVVDRGCTLEGAVADGVGNDLANLRRRVAKRLQRLRHRPVDDLEVPAAGQLLELHQGEVGLDAGGVAVHDEADGAGGRDHRRLGVAVSVLLAEFHRAVPGALRGLAERPVGQVGVIERHRANVEALEALALAAGGGAVVAHHPQHGVPVVVERGEGADARRPFPPRLA